MRLVRGIVGQVCERGFSCVLQYFNRFVGEDVSDVLSRSSYWSILVSIQLI